MRCHCTWMVAGLMCAALAVASPVAYAEELYVGSTDVVVHFADSDDSPSEDLPQEAEGNVTQEATVVARAGQLTSASNQGISSAAERRQRSDALAQTGDTVLRPAELVAEVCAGSALVIGSIALRRKESDDEH